MIAVRTLQQRLKIKREENNMSWAEIQNILAIIQHIISVMGVVIILFGIIFAVSKYCYFIASGQVKNQGQKINTVRIDLARFLLLGLEFIVAADLIGSTTTPDYYALGILAIIVAIRTLLSYSLSREILAAERE